MRTEPSSAGRSVVQAYFVDGYHGGIKGHMPIGAWTDVLHVLRSHPEWKISIEVEPISWEHVRMTDPESYRELRDRWFGSEYGQRVEIVSGSYAQPYGWAIGGESNIRQLLRGIALHREHFPHAVIDTYAVQEPCWTSCLPQVLKSLGYKRAVLKNPGTAWAGYPSGLNREIVNWVGPDGSAIPCVPRYACEGLVHAWESEAAEMGADFLDQCAEQGIARPIGSFLQDLGWAAAPRLGTDGRVTYVTWRQYFEEVVGEPQEDWRFTQEDIHCALPWGERHLQRMARQIRSAESKLVQAEKLAALAVVLHGYNYPERELARAWDELMLSQHHDAWICATVRERREKWSWLAGAQTWLAEANADAVMGEAAASFAGPVAADGSLGIRVFNTTGVPRKEIVEMEIPVTEDLANFGVVDETGRLLPRQVHPLRTSGEGRVQAARLLFEAEVPSMGCRTFGISRQAAGRSEPESSPVGATMLNDRLLLLYSDLYELRLDLEQGGAIVSLIDRSTRRNYCPPQSPVFLNELRGYMTEQGRFAYSRECKVAATILENGPLRVTVQLDGVFCNTKFQSTLRLSKGQRAIDCGLRAWFEADRWIGDPWTIDEQIKFTERRRSHYHTAMNLHVLFPVRSKSVKVFKNAAFDVCESKHTDTHYTRWDEIKHNVILHWIDLFDAEEQCGLAVYSDHTTSYGHSPEDQAYLTFAWGGDAGFWWGKCPLEGLQEMNYAIVPHEGDWESAGLSRLSALRQEPLMARLASGSRGKLELIRLSDPKVEVSAMYIEKDKLWVRLFNGSASGRDCLLYAHDQLANAEIAELDGRVVRALAPESGAAAGEDGSYRLSFPPFGLMLIAFSFGKSR